MSMTANLIFIGIQPSEIEAMSFSKMQYYNEFAEIMLKAKAQAMQGI